MNAYSVQVRFQASDLPLLNGHGGSVNRSHPFHLTAISANDCQASNSTVHSGTSSANTSSASASTSPPNHPISAGAAAGIGVGVAVAVILAFFGALLLVRRYRHRRPKNVFPENAGQVAYMASSSPHPPKDGLQTRHDSTLLSASPHISMALPAGHVQGHNAQLAAELQGQAYTPEFPAH